MSNILTRIEKARQRLGFDLDGLLEQFKGGTPRSFTKPAEQAERYQFLRDSLGSEAAASKIMERVLDGNELQPVNYLERGQIAAQAIARICIRQASGQLYGWGTGFLVAPRVLITNNHVLPGPEWARESEAQFEYETNLADQPVGPIVYRLLPQQLFYTSPALDFTVVAVEAEAVDSQRPLTHFGCLPLLDKPGKSFEGEWLTIIQHPEGERKQVCVRENRLLRRDADVLWYSTDTLEGASGSPVFNNDWYVVALHHCGVPEEKDGRIQTLAGRDYDPNSMDERQIKWKANEGVRASRIAQTLRQELPREALLQPLFAATPESVRITAPFASDPISTTAPKQTLTPLAMSQENFRTVTIPLQITLQINTDPAAPASQRAALAGTQEAATLEATKGNAETSATKKKQPAFDVPFENNYDHRKGYDPEFLGSGSKKVNFPKLSDALEKEAVPLIKPTANNRYCLHYHHFSVVMHQTRRFAMYSAANLSFAQRYEMGRPADVWREDPRIPLTAQVTKFYYASNQFDRGHLTRREDLEFGDTPMAALQAAADTCHWTNCTPQHARFNQNKEIWQGIERHILENAIVANHFKAQVITGPVLDQGDPEYKKIQYPLQFWKVVAALNAEGQLFATAYLASQESVIAQFGVEAAPEVPFTPYKTFQVPIAEIERLTQLSFTYGEESKKLSDFDPLRTIKPAKRQRLRTHESAFAETADQYLEIASLDDIITG
jgi:endonuclease G, mitochondrial